MVQAKLHQSEASQFKDLHAGLFYAIRSHVDGERGQVGSTPVPEHAVEPANQGVVQADAQLLQHLQNIVT
jgi:hypothetical protein